MEIAVITIGALLFASLFFSWVFDKFNIPDVLPLFLIGLFFGPITGIVDIDSFGAISELFATVTLAIILFEAGLYVKIKSLFKSAGKATLLIIAQLLGVAVLLMFVSKLVFGVSYLLGLIIGVILAGTSGTIVIPLIQNLKIKEETKTLLKLEGILGNIVVIVLVFALLNIVDGGVFSFHSILEQFTSTFVISILIGMACAFIWSQIVAKLRGIQDSLFTTPAFLLILFGITEFLGGSGAMAVFAFGITLGNLQDFKLGSFKLFKRLKNFTITKKEETLFSSLVFVFKTYFFVFIGLSINLDRLDLILWGAVIAAALFAVRYFVVDLIFKGSLPDFDLDVIKIMAPRGLTEAALLTFIGNEVFNGISYPIIMFTIIFTSILTFYVKGNGDLDEYQSNQDISQESFKQLP